MKDTERFYFVTRQHGMSIGCHVTGAQTLVRRLTEAIAVAPEADLVLLTSLGGRPSWTDPLGGQASLPSWVDA